MMYHVFTSLEYLVETHVSFSHPTYYLGLETDHVFSVATD